MDEVRLYSSEPQQIPDDLKYFSKSISILVILRYVLIADYQADEVIQTVVDAIMEASRGFPAVTKVIQDVLKSLEREEHEIKDKCISDAQQALHLKAVLIFLTNRIVCVRLVAYWKEEPEVLQGGPTHAPRFQEASYMHSERLSTSCERGSVFTRRPSTRVELSRFRQEEPREVRQSCGHISNLSLSSHDLGHGRKRRLGPRCSFRGVSLHGSLPVSGGLGPLDQCRVDDASCRSRRRRRMGRNARDAPGRLLLPQGDAGLEGAPYEGSQGRRGARRRPAREEVRGVSCPRRHGPDKRRLGAADSLSKRFPATSRRVGCRSGRRSGSGGSSPCHPCFPSPVPPATLPEGRSLGHGPRRAGDGISGTRCAQSATVQNDISLQDS